MAASSGCQVDPLSMKKLDQERSQETKMLRTEKLNRKIITLITELQIYHIRHFKTLKNFLK